MAFELTPAREMELDKIAKDLPDSPFKKLYGKDWKSVKIATAMNILKKNQTLSVFSKSKKVSITIYDGGKEDGDKITIYANKKVVLNNYEANKEKRIISLNLIDDKTSIVIKAENEGKIAPNTVIVEIEDSKNNIKALSNLKQGETTQIDFLKAQ